MNELENKCNIILLDKSNIMCTTLLTIEQALKVPEKYRYADIDWWLRSTGYSSRFAAYVYYDGVVRFSGPVNNNGGVRPALYLKNSKSLNLKIGGIYEIGGEQFIYVLPGILLTRGAVGKCAFRTEKHCIEMSDCKSDSWWADGQPYNDYETSDVKKFVDDWFENL